MTIFESNIIPNNMNNNKFLSSSFTTPAPSQVMSIFVLEYTDVDRGLSE